MIVEDLEKAKLFFSKKGLPTEIEKNKFKITIDEKNIADLLMLLAKEKIEYREITINKPDLEDYFLEVVKEET